MQKYRYNNEQLFTKSNIQSITFLLWFAVATLGLDGVTLKRVNLLSVGRVGEALQSFWHW